MLVAADASFAANLSLILVAAASFVNTRSCCFFAADIYGLILVTAAASFVNPRKGAVSFASDIG